MSATAFVFAALRYWLDVFPRTCRQLRRARRRAARIPDPTLREAALAALGKAGNIEGAAALAAWAPRRRRRAVTDALVAYQTIYNYTDVLAEQPTADPRANARSVHEALIAALQPLATSHPDYYAASPWRGDGGYLAEQVEACRRALLTLPGFSAVAPMAMRGALRIACFQQLTCAAEREQLIRWADRAAPPGSELEWWEIAAAAGSSLPVHVAIAAAAGRHPAERELEALEEAYFPWIGALHSLLDSLLDEREDACQGQLSLIGCYGSREQARVRICALVARAREMAGELGGVEHRILLAAMASYYLSCLPEGVDPVWAALAVDIRRELGGLATAALLVFRTRRLISRAHDLPTRVSRWRGRLATWRSPREGLAAIELDDA